MWKILEKRPFFRADTAGLGKYCTGGYGRIGVYRVNLRSLNITINHNGSAYYTFMIQRFYVLERLE